MALRADVPDLEHRTVAQFALNRKVVLGGVLRAQVRAEFSIEKNRAKQRQIGGLALGGGDNSAKRIRTSEVALSHVRSIEKGLSERGTATKGRFGAELGHHQLFDRVIEKSPAGANAGFAIAAENLRQRPTTKVGAIGNANARGKRLVIGRSQSGGNAGVARNHQTGGRGTSVGAGGIRHAKALPVGLASRVSCGVNSAGVNGGILSRPEGLHVAADVFHRGSKFPTQTVVQGQVGLDLPTILNEGIYGGAANIFAMAGTLNI